MAEKLWPVPKRKPLEPDKTGAIWTDPKEPVETPPGDSGKRPAVSEGENPAKGKILPYLLELPKRHKIITTAAVTAIAIGAAALGVHQLRKHTSGAPPAAPGTTASVSLTPPGSNTLAPGRITGPPAASRTAPSPVTTPSATPAGPPAAIMPPSGRITTPVTPPTERKLQILPEVKRVHDEYWVMGYNSGGVVKIVDEMNRISKNSGGTGEVSSMPFTLNPKTPVENEIKREWDAVQFIVQNGGREDPQNPPSWYTTDEWMKIMEKGHDRWGMYGNYQVLFASAILAKEYAVLRDLENQRLNGFRGGVYVLPDETKAAEFIINHHRIPLAGINIRTSRESQMTAADYEEYEKEFIKTHGAKQNFEYNAKGKTTKIQGWRDTAQGIIHLSPEAYVSDLEVQKLNEQYGPIGEVKVAGNVRKGWMLRDSNAVMYIGDDGTIKRVGGVRLPPRTPTAPTTTTPAPGGPATAAPLSAAPQGKTVKELEEETTRIKAETRRAQAEAELRRAKQDAEKSRYRTYEQRRRR